MLHTFSCLASVKYTVNELQRPLQLTILRASVIAMPWISCMQRHLLVDAVHVCSLVLDSVQVRATQPMLIPPALQSDSCDATQTSSF